MLKQLRQKKVMKRILVLLAAIIIPAFVLWGAGGLREGRNYAGTLFGKKIGLDEYRDAFNAAKNQALLTHGSNFYNMRDQLNLERAAWDHLIMVKEAKRMKIEVSDEEVVTRIVSIPFFQNKDGSFSEKTYELMLNNVFRTNPRSFEEEVRQSLMIEKLVLKIVKGIEVTDEEMEEFAKNESGDRGLKQQRQLEQTKTTIMTIKRIEAYREWLDDLYREAEFINNLEKQKELEEEKQEEKLE